MADKDVASSISDKQKTALTSVWVDGSWVNVGDTNQRNNMQNDLNKVGKLVGEQQTAISDAVNVASSATAQASQAIESSKVNSQSIVDVNSAVAVANSDASDALTSAQTAMSNALANSSAVASLDSSMTASISSANDRITSATSAIDANTKAISANEVANSSAVANLTKTVTDNATSANSAIADAKAEIATNTKSITAVKTIADSAQSASVTATKTASDASVTAVDAKSDAVVATQSATKAQTTAVNAQSDATTAIQTASEASVTATDANSNAVLATQSATKAQTTATNLASDVTVATQTASEASVTATNASKDATTALTTASGASVTASKANSLATTASVTATGAQTTATNAQSDATVATQTATKAQTTATNASKDAMTALTTASGASVTATNAKSDVAVVKATASETSANLKTAQGDITSLKASASQASLDIADNKKNVASVTATAKALQATVSANSSAVAGLTTTTTSQATQIDQNSKQIALKANQTDLDTLNGTVKTAQASITTNANAIKEKVSSSDVTGLLTKGGYATQDWTTTQVTTASNKWNVNLTSLQTQVNNIDVGGRNYLMNTFDSGFKYSQGSPDDIAKVTKEKDATDGSTVIHVQVNTDNSNGIYFYTSEPLVVGDSWTLSADIKGTGHIASFGHEGAGAMNNFDLSKSYVREICTNKIVSGSGAFVIYGAKGSEYWVKLIKVEKGTVATDWTPAPEDLATASSVTNLTATVDGIQSTVANKVNATDYNSKVTQLSNLINAKVATTDYNAEITVLNNNINSKVAKGSTISQINQEAGGNTLIQVASGKGKLLLDADSVVFSGNAFIPDAYITNLSVDKLKAGTMTGVSSQIGTSYSSVLDNSVKYSVGLTNDGVKVGDVFKGSLDETDFTTMNTISQSATNTANASTTATADVTSPTLFTIDGSKLSNGDRVLVKLNINYSNFTGTLGAKIALQSTGGVSFDQQYLTTGYFTYNFVIVWSASLGTGKVAFNLKGSAVQPKSNFYVLGANLYTDHGASSSSANYYESSGGIYTNGSLKLQDYYAGTNEYATNKIYNTLQWDQGVLRLSNYEYDATNGSTTGSWAPYYETQIDATGIRFVGSLESEPLIEFMGDVSHEKLISAMTYTHFGVSYAGARDIANGSYFDRYGNINGYQISKAWNVSSFSGGNVLHVALDNNSASPSSFFSPGPLGLRSTGQSTELYMGQRHVIIDNPANSNSSNYDVKFEIKGYIEMTGWLTCKGLTQTSLLSKKTNIKSLDSATALDVINSTGIYEYQFKSDVETDGVNAKHHYSPIIDDVNDTPQYATPNQFIAENKQGRDDGDILGYVVASIQELSKQVTDLKTQLAELTK